MKTLTPSMVHNLFASTLLSGLLALTACSDLPSNAGPIVAGSTTVAVNDSPFYTLSEKPHDVRILENGLEALQMRLNLIANAKSSIEYETFIFNKDRAGRAILLALVNKAKSMTGSAMVRLMVDGSNIGGDGQLNAYDLKALNQIAGSHLEVRLYNPNKVDLVKFNHRDHRKLIVTDGTNMITGGRNTQDRYFGLDQSNPQYNYMDREILVNGPIAESARETFDRYWSNTSWVATLSAAFSADDVKDAGRLKKALSYLTLGQSATDKSFALFLTHLNTQAQSYIQAHKQAQFAQIHPLILVTDHPEHQEFNLNYQPYPPDRVVSPWINFLVTQSTQGFTIENYAIAMTPVREKLFNQLILGTSSAPPPRGFRILTNGFPTADTNPPFTTELAHLVESNMVYRANKQPGLFHAYDLIGNAFSPNDLFGGVSGAEAKPIWGTHTKSAVFYAPATIASQLRSVVVKLDPKAAVPTGTTTWISSYNLDPRSEAINCEIGIATLDPAVAKFVDEQITARIQAVAQELDKTALTSGHYKDGTSVFPVSGTLIGTIEFDVIKDVFSGLYEADRSKAKSYLVDKLIFNQF